ncbi:MAG TPA: FHA domain-containing protein [Polyangiaceae bacterium]|nr:FHA domain-containing protein [Polyangiaceae bacterium]
MHDSVSKSATTASGPRRPLALRFISGKYQGGEFPMVPNKEIVVGRSSDLDMVLVEEMVSRKHARIAYENDAVVIEDLGSTNGTFVNGEKIKRAQLKEGDRVLIGTSILKVIVMDGSSHEQGRPNLEVVAAQRRTSSPRTMSGSIDEVPLPDLLQLFSTSKKSGALVIRTEEDIGRIFLQKGIIYYASINDLGDLAPIKSIFRMLTWQKGLFDFDASDLREFPKPVEVTVQEILMESLRQLDELNAFRDQLPALSARIVLDTPLVPPLRDLSPEDLDVLQLAHNFNRFGTLLDKSQATDVDTARIVLKLIQKNYLRVE